MNQQQYDFNQKFILDEEKNMVPVPLLTWAKWFDKDENRIVQFDTVKDLTGREHLMFRLFF